MKVFTLITKKLNKETGEMEINKTERFLFDRKALDEKTAGFDKMASFQKGRKSYEVIETEEESIWATSRNRQSSRS